MTTNALCSYFTCLRQGSYGANGLGYCKMHYNKLWKIGLHKKLDKQNKVNVVKCIVKDCQGKYWAKGFCNRCYKRFRKGQSLV